KLRIHVDDISNGGSPNGGTFKRMTNTTWSETAGTWNNQPAIDGAPGGTPGSVARNTWDEIDVTATVTGNSACSSAATSANNDGAYYDSRETGATAPQLVVTTNPPPPPPPTTPPPPPPGDPVFVGAGDIAGAGSSQEATALLLDNIAGTVYTLGDNAYDSGTTAEYNTYYDP